MSTSIAAVLAGAIARNRGGTVAAQSAIPLTLWWSVMFLVALFTGTIGFGLLSLAAIPLTILTSAYCGKFGEQLQRERFPDTTLFGIYPYHFIWLIIPLFVYAVMVAAWFPYFAEALFRNWPGAGLAESLAHLLSLIYTSLPFLGFWSLFYLVYKILTGTIFKIRSEWGRALLTIALLVAAPVIFYRFLLFVGRLMALMPVNRFSS